MVSIENNKYRELGKILNSTIGIHIRLLLLISSVLFASQIQASTAQSFYKSDLSTTRLLTDVVTTKPGKSFWVLMEIIPRPGWHTYWKNPGDSGMPITLNWQKPEGVIIDEIRWLPPERIKIAHLINYGYPEKAYFLIQVHVSEDFEENSIDLQLNASWLICDKECIPDEATYKLAIAIDDHQESSQHSFLIHDIVQKYSSIKTAEISGFTEKGFLHFKIPDFVRNTNDVYLFLEDEGLIIPNAPQEIVKIRGQDYLKTKHAFMPLQSGLKGYLTFRDSGEAKAIRVEVSSESILEIPLLMTIIAFAFLGGLILNAMPCVLPVLFLKVFSVINRAPSRKETILNAFCYTFGIVISFLCLASILIFFKMSGEEIGWGFQLQSPAFIILLALLFLIIGFNFLGFYEFITFNVSAPFSKEQKYLNEFFTGILAVLVASPCTAPFMATSIGIALTQSNTTILLIFSFLGLGLASPYLLISLCPPLSSLLPKPGNWMILFKKVLAIPMFGTTVWLLWVLSQQIQLIDFYYTLMLVALMALAIILIRIIRSKMIQYLLITTIIALATYATFLSENSNKVSSYANRVSVQELMSMIGKKDLFINITASWCITCKVNETLVLSDEDLLKTIKDKGVTYITLDWTTRNDEISRFMKKYKRRGVPVYLFIPKDGKASVLPQVLTKSIVMQYLENIDKKPGGLNAN